MSCKTPWRWCLPSVLTLKVWWWIGRAWLRLKERYTTCIIEYMVFRWKLYLIHNTPRLLTNPLLKVSLNHYVLLMKEIIKRKKLMLTYWFISMIFFWMKEDKDIKNMFSRFQTLVFGLQVLNKSYIVSDHVKKILRSLSAKLRPKVTSIHDTKDTNKHSLENLISSLKSHEMELIGDEPTKKSKSIAQKSMGKFAKALQAVES